MIYYNPSLYSSSSLESSGLSDSPPCVTPRLPRAADPAGQHEAMAGPKNGDGDAVRRPGPVTAADPFQLLADLHAALRDGRWDGPRGILFTEILRCARALLGPDEAGHAAPCVGAGGPAQGPSQTGPAPSASPSAASAPPSPPQLPRAALPTFLEAEECAAALGLVEGMYDVLTDLQWLKHRRPSEPRSSDGILQVGQTRSRRSAVMHLTTHPHQKAFLMEDNQFLKRPGF